MVPALVPPPAAPAGSREGAWVTTYSDPQAVDNLSLPVGSGLEILTVDENGQVNGTALIKVTLPYDVSHEGRFFEGEFAGASAMLIWFSGAVQSDFAHRHWW